MTATPAGLPTTLRVLGIAGSLRRGSYNAALLRAAAELAPPGLEVIIFPLLGELPLYNGDLDVGDGPEPVAALRRALRETDALLITTPEYNFGIPGVLKNALDWASRPPQTTALHGMPAGIMGAATGLVGTARAQLALRQAFVFTQTHPLSAPEVLVSKAQEKFDEGGQLRDEATRTVVRDYMERLRHWALQLRQRVE
jgi:chromate reductase